MKSMLNIDLSKNNENIDFTKEDLKETLDQVKMLKVKTNLKIQQYERTNEQQKLEIQKLKEQLLEQVTQKGQLLYRLKQTEEKAQKYEECEKEKNQIQTKLEEKQIMVEYLRKQVDEYQKKYYQMKERLQEKDNQKQTMKNQILKYQIQTDKINKVLGTQIITDIEQWLFLDNLTVIKYLQIQQQQKSKIKSNMIDLSSNLKIKQETLNSLKEQMQQVKELLSLSQNKNIVLEESQRNLHSLQTQLRLQLNSKTIELTKIQQDTLLLKSSLLQLSTQSHRQQQLLKQFTFRDEQSKKQIQLQLEYSVLIDQVLGQKDEFSIIGQRIDFLQSYKIQCQNNVSKIQFLCQQLQTS